MISNKELLLKAITDAIENPYGVLIRPNHILRFSHSDILFFKKLGHVIYHQNKITSNQDQLFNKLVKKYRKQLKKYFVNTPFFDPDKIEQLPWKKVTVIQSDPKFKIPSVWINNGNINLRVPHKKEFMSKVNVSKKYLIHFASDSYIAPAFSWVPEERIYTTKYTQRSLRYITSLCQKHIDTVVYCDDIQKKLSSLDLYKDCKYWSPTLVNIRGRWYIMAANNSLYNAIKHIDFDQMDTNKIAKTAELYGINIINNETSENNS